MTTPKKDKQDIRFDHWRFVELRIRRATGAAELQFLDEHSKTVAVTIPLGQLGRLHRRIEQELRKDEALFSPESKKVFP
jgi:hypothetical protein